MRVRQKGTKIRFKALEFTINELLTQTIHSGRIVIALVTRTRDYFQETTDHLLSSDEEEEEEQENA